MSRFLPRFRRRSTRRLAERAAVRGLSPREARRLGRIFAEDPAEQRAYGSLMDLFRAMERGPALTSSQQQRILRGVVQAVGAERPLADASPWLTRLAPALSLCVLLAVATASMTLGPDRGTSQGLQARGATGPDPVRGGPGEVGLRAFCLHQGAVRADLSASRSSGALTVCRSGDELQLMLKHTGRSRHLLVVGQLMPRDGGEDKLVWYYPVPPTGSSAPAPRRGEYSPLGQALRLNINHRPGEVRLVALFSMHPLLASEVFTWLTSLPAEAGAEDLLERLGRHQEIDAVEARIRILGDEP